MHSCVKTPTAHYCACKMGYSLLNDQRTCEGMLFIIINLQFANQRNGISISIMLFQLFVHNSLFIFLQMRTNASVVQLNAHRSAQTVLALTSVHAFQGTSSHRMESLVMVRCSSLPLHQSCLFQPIIASQVYNIDEAKNLQLPVKYYGIVSRKCV